MRARVGTNGELSPSVPKPSVDPVAEQWEALEQRTHPTSSGPAKAETSRLRTQGPDLKKPNSR